MRSPVLDLIEALITALNGAFKRSLLCVDSKVVEQIVPLLKELATLRVVTGKCLGGAACGSTYVGDLGEVPRVGDMLFVYKFWELYSFPVMDI